MFSTWLLISPAEASRSSALLARQSRSLAAISLVPVFDVPDALLHLADAVRSRGQALVNRHEHPFVDSIKSCFQQRNRVGPREAGHESEKARRQGNECDNSLEEHVEFLRTSAASALLFGISSNLKLPSDGNGSGQLSGACWPLQVDL